MMRRDFLQKSTLVAGLAGSQTLLTPLLASENKTARAAPSKAQATAASKEVCTAKYLKHSGEIALLPALPAAWSDGHFRGMKARGDVEVDARWQTNRALSAALRPAVTREFKLRPPHGQHIAKVETGGHAIAMTEINGYWRVRLEAHKEYAITFE